MGMTAPLQCLPSLIICFVKSMREMHGLARLMNCWRSTWMSKLPKRQDFQMIGETCQDGGAKTTPLP